MVCCKEFPSIRHVHVKPPTTTWETFPCHQDEFGELFLLCSLAERPKQTSQVAGCSSLRFRFQADRIQREMDGGLRVNTILLEFEYRLSIDLSDQSPSFLCIVIVLFVDICFFVWNLKVISIFTCLVLVQ